MAKEKDIITEEEIDFNDGIFHFVITGGSNSYDIAKIIRAKGLKWSRNDIDSSKAGRTLSGLMNRGRVCQKVKMEITCVPLNQELTNKVLKLINPEYVLVHYIDPLLGERDVQFYSNNVPTTFVSQATDGSMLWNDLAFPLVER